MTKKRCEMVKVAAATGDDDRVQFNLFCEVGQGQVSHGDGESWDRGLVGYIEILQRSLRGNSVWEVENIRVLTPEQRKGYATKLYEAAAKHACLHEGRLASTYRTEGAYSHDFWNKQEKKGRAERIPYHRDGSGSPSADDFFVLNVCGPSIDLSGLPRRNSMRTNLGDPLLASILVPWLAAPLALMLLLKPTPASAALTPTTTKFTQPPADILNVLKVASQKTGVPLPILIGVAHTETRYKPYLTSSKGAAGLMQLMPKTAESLGVTDRLDPMQSALGGAKLLKSMYSLYGNWDQALAAYNWGQGNVNKNPEPSQWIPRTRAYVANVQYIAKNV